jgi:hypothetical protein
MSHYGLVQVGQERDRIIPSRRLVIVRVVEQPRAHGKRTSIAWKTKELCQVTHVPSCPLPFHFQRPLAGFAAQQG